MVQVKPTEPEKVDRSTATGQPSSSSPGSAITSGKAPSEAAQVAVKSEAMLANEQSARLTCEQSTKAQRQDAVQVCARAAAVTLMNSGVLSAINGKLDDAEKDYLAAKEKDSELPELYFNLAILKARQNKGAEAVNYLT